ncbi:transglycosylase SLT domain-containing protein [Shewanella donghaensis]|uniref:transglycosylase SLT domain-containing protein n=1 Tax=Shewanella donghaensis TaxID=238836 RepID=UPI0011843127|nr:transglycosylase SLT domain-containing protein [Shewanella donghaensis]
MRNMLVNSFIVMAFLSIAVLPKLADAKESSYTTAQQQYLDARKALDKKQMTTYQKLRKQLGDYPLTVYLDYHEQLANILTLPGSEAHEAIEHFNTTPLYNNLRYRYLKNAGKRKQWQNFLAISPTTPNDVTLQCYYYRAQLAQGNEKAAYDGAEKLWLYGRSRPEECDVLFDEWTKAGKRTQPLIWSRMLLSFNDSQYGLMQYLARKITKNTDYADLLISVYRDPNSLRHTKKFSSKAPIVADIVNVGLRKLARKDLKQAVKLYNKYDKANRFTAIKGQQLNRYIVRRALIRKESDLLDHIDASLPILDSDDLFQIRLRWAISDQDTKTITHYLGLLSDDVIDDARWQYWSARDLKTSDKVKAEKVTTQLSQARNFYGFHAAQSIIAPLALNDDKLQSSPELASKLNDDPGLARIIELIAIDKTRDARSEWVHLLRRHNKDMQAEYGLLALKNGWFDYSVEASIQARQWNSLALRFPDAAQQDFEQASKQYKVNIDEIRAIARRESAFYPYATSGVGARGLMQLMPATAKETARKNKLSFKNKNDLYKVNYNIQLGSAYYGQLLKQFDQNRVLATAAYNAGPHRVTRWLKESDGKLDVMSFIETIPFKETREYVQAVISYRMIYQQQKGADASMFTDAEKQYLY